MISASQGKEVAYLVKQLEGIYNGIPWYGEAITKILEGVDFEMAIAKLQGGTHSIYELIDHILSWKIYVLRKLEGDEKYELEFRGPEDWKVFQGLSPEDWSALLQRYYEVQLQIVKVLEMKKEDELAVIVPGKTYNFRFLLHGMIQHDLYHMGQISMLKSMFSK